MAELPNKVAFLFDKRLEMWYNIYSVKKRRGETPLKISPPSQFFVATNSKSKGRPSGVMR